VPRANRHFIPGYVWHITHRCHKKEFLLKFARDRRRWLQWLFEAKKRYGLSVLNYMVTSNHIHLLVRDKGERDVIPNSIQLIAGRTGQEFNQRKNRKGAYWEDRYHATAVETDTHLIQCMVYMDLNMVRAGVVGHPSEWAFSGYNEIQAPRQRYALIDYEGLRDLVNVRGMGDLAEAYRGWVEESIEEERHVRDGKWTESVAVGSEAFVTATKEKLGVKVKGREMIDDDGTYVLRE
jgi:REP element-mobilizing transposase RayT